MTHSRKIAIFVSHIYGRFQTELCQGVVDEAIKAGYQVDIFTTNDGKYLGQQEHLEESILQVPNLLEYAGIILASCTYRREDLRDTITSTLQKECSCPIVDIPEMPESDFPHVILDNDSPFRELTRHLIDVHNCRNIWYLGSSSEQYHSHKRKEYIQNTLKEKDLPLAEDQFLEIDYQMDLVKEVVTSFTQAGPVLQ